MNLRELCQLITGNALLCFSLRLLVEILLVDGFAVLEHPAEPLSDPAAASIWRLPVIRALAEFPQVKLIRFAQGLLGAASAKPTQLLVVNMLDLLLTLHANRVCVDLPKGTSIGKDGKGRWKTTALKEYPPELCSCLATEFGKALASTPVLPECVPMSPSELAQIRTMIINEYGSVIGADYVAR